MVPKLVFVGISKYNKHPKLRPPKTVDFIYKNNKDFM